MFFDKTYKPKSIEEDLVSEILSFSESYEGSINDLGSSIEQKFKDQLDEASYLDRLGSVYFRINLLDKATVIAELNVKLFPDNSGSLENLAYVYLNNDKKQKALASYKKVLSLNPENSYAREMVSELNSK
jgi:tetratricopeptide (TPR) repeat protein